MSQLCLLVVHSSISMKESSQGEEGWYISPSSSLRHKVDAQNKNSFICKDLISITILNLDHILVIHWLYKGTKINSFIYKDKIFIKKFNLT